MSEETEQVGRLSPMEERFELWRRRIGLFAGPLLALALYAMTGAWPAEQRRLAAVLVFVIVFWVTEAIPIPATALLGPALCGLLGVAEVRVVLRAFADPVIFVFLGSFLLARAMTANGLDRRVALGVLGSRFIGRSPARIRLAAGATAFLLSMWISNTATVAILFPIVVGISDALDRLFAEGATRSYTTGLMLMIAYAASVGGMSTPIGSPPNLIGLGMIDNLAGRRIPFFEWMVLALPITLILFGLLAVLLRVLHPAPARSIEGLAAAVAELRQGIAPWGRAQSYTLVAFLTAVVLWVGPGALALLRGTSDPLYRAVSDRLHEGVVALLAASLLFLLPVEWKPPRGALTWKEAVQIDWGTILLFGGGLSLGGLMYSTKLAERFAHGLLGAAGEPSLWTITAVATLCAILVTETTSNTASASMVVPVAIAVAQAAGVSPLPPALGATFGASLAFMLPVSTPPNAIVYGSGRVSLLAMLRAGIWFDLLAFGLILLLLRWLCPLLGLL
ncbi:MAG TPA: DASS family sodium-coupled anion symporter [Candidatus Acidoferrales bacterium]|nr:DASS family sodium-coupled anion symporter [Candidatus Acidoferrales bacterium]